MKAIAKKAAAPRLRARRAVWEAAREFEPMPGIEDLDLAYRTLCAVLYNWAPTSGHPGGSISSGRIAQRLVFSTLDYDLARPRRQDSDLLVYAAGHKALGLYALWALRNELVRLACPRLLPPEEDQLRLEDLLGFRRNASRVTAAMRRWNCRLLDGHPTPAVPHVPVATGASGVGLGAAVGLALAAADLYGERAPRVHVIEGEGGLTPGRASEALAAAAATGLRNLVLHVDWNQSSIDSDRVCAEGGMPGDYVQWDPRELAYLHDWNVIEVGDGLDPARIAGAQGRAASIPNSQPTAIIYRTVKGWRYGVEGKASHGAGHAFGSEGYRKAVEPFERRFGVGLPEAPATKDPEARDEAFAATLLAVREALARRTDLAEAVATAVDAARERLEARARAPRARAPKLDALYGLLDPARPPEPARVKPGESAALRGALGKALGALNDASGGALLGCAADLLDSTSLSPLAGAAPKGFFHSTSNPTARLVPVGGICEDAMGAVMAGVSSFGAHVGVTSSYSAFIAALEHVPARLHAIGQAAAYGPGRPARTWIMVNAHAGPMTGEDGPTHADPQALQLLQHNFPPGALITLTPWDPQEVWPLLAAGLAARPAVLCPFVTRPATTVLDREALGLCPAAEAVTGVYRARKGYGRAAVVLQGAAVAQVFFRDVLPELDRRGSGLDVFYVASAELFGLLPAAEQEEIFPSSLRARSIGITDFTWPTLLPWLSAAPGLSRSLYPFARGSFLNSGPWEHLMTEGGLDAEGQLEAALSWESRP